MKTETDGASSVKVQSAQEQIESMRQLSERQQYLLQAENRIKVYIDQAETFVATAKDDERREDLRLLIAYGKTALIALAERDINILILNFDMLHQYRLKLNMPAIISAFNSKIGGPGGKVSKRGPSRVERIVLERYCGDIGSCEFKHVTAAWEAQSDPDEGTGAAFDFQMHFIDGPKLGDRLYLFKYSVDAKEFTKLTRTDISRVLSDIKRANRKNQK